MALTLTVTGPARRTADGVEVPVVGGTATVLCEAPAAERLLRACREGARMEVRLADSGPGWWLATAARVEGGF